MSRYVRWVGGADPYEVEKPLVWRTRQFSGMVPRGFRCDGGSTGPAGCVGFPSVGDEMERGYIVHDHLYRVPRFSVTRHSADKIMRTIHKQDGAGWLKRTAAWWAVRRFGKNAWRKYR